MTFECGYFKGCKKCQCMVCKWSNSCDRWGVCQEVFKANPMFGCDMFKKKKVTRRDCKK